PPSHNNKILINMHFNLSVTVMALVMPEHVAADDCGLDGLRWVCCITRTGSNFPNQSCFQALAPSATSRPPAAASTKHLSHYTASRL
ncbi:hypothetical protein BG000_004239, partial [Podila horticola]